MMPILQLRSWLAMSGCALCVEWGLYALFRVYMR